MALDLYDALDREYHFAEKTAGWAELHFVAVQSDQLAAQLSTRSVESYPIQRKRPRDRDDLGALLVAGTGFEPATSGL